MKVIFADPALETLYLNGATSTGKYKKLSRNKKLVEGYQRAVMIMYAVSKTDELKSYSFLHYEQLKHDPHSSVRIQNGCVERLLFTETEDRIEVQLIEIDSTHYGNR